MVSMVSILYVLDDITSKGGLPWRVSISNYFMLARVVRCTCYFLASFSHSEMKMILKCFLPLSFPSNQLTVKADIHSSDDTVSTSSSSSSNHDHHHHHYEDIDPAALMAQETATGGRHKSTSSSRRHGGRSQKSQQKDDASEEEAAKRNKSLQGLDDLIAGTYDPQTTPYNELRICHKLTITTPLVGWMRVWCSRVNLVNLQSTVCQETHDL